MESSQSVDQQPSPSSSSSLAAVPLSIKDSAMLRIRSVVERQEKTLSDLQMKLSVLTSLSSKLGMTSAAIPLPIPAAATTSSSIVVGSTRSMSAGPFESSGVAPASASSVVAASIPIVVALPNINTSAANSCSSSPAPPLRCIGDTLTMERPSLAVAGGGGGGGAVCVVPIDSSSPTSSSPVIVMRPVVTGKSTSSQRHNVTPSASPPKGGYASMTHHHLVAPTTTTTTSVPVSARGMSKKRLSASRTKAVVAEVVQKVLRRGSISSQGKTANLKVSERVGPSAAKRSKSPSQSNGGTAASSKNRGGGVTTVTPTLVSRPPLATPMPRTGATSTSNTTTTTTTAHTTGSHHPHHLRTASSKWDMNLRMRELEDIQASNSQALERTHSSTFSRTHSLLGRTNRTDASSPPRQMEGGGGESNHDSSSSATVAHAAMAAFEAMTSTAKWGAEVPPTTTTDSIPSARGGRGGIKKISTSKLSAKSPRVFVERLATAILEKQQEQQRVKRAQQYHVDPAGPIADPSQAHGEPQNVTPSPAIVAALGAPAMPGLGRTQGKHTSGSTSVSVSGSSAHTNNNSTTAAAPPHTRTATASVTRPPWSTTTRVAPQPKSGSLLPTRSTALGGGRRFAAS